MQVKTHPNGTNSVKSKIPLSIFFISIPPEVLFMSFLYRLLDKFFDPPPKWLDKTGKVIYYDTQDERYKRYKHLCYRNLLLKSVLAFLLGILFSVFLGGLIRR
nr:MAG TPA: hypothetical protein [Caudoviricetes sp.]